MRVLLTSLLLLFATPAFGGDRERPSCGQIREITLAAARATLSGKPESFPARHREMKGSCGVFVTLTENGRTRGCWGGIEPQCGDLAAEIAYCTRKALVGDYRFSPVNPAELPSLRFYVSLVGTLKPVDSWRGLRPLREGLFLVGGGHGAVLLPGEARTAAWQVNECRRKAGIRPGTPVRMYRFGTTVFGPLGVQGEQ